MKKHTVPTLFILTLTSPFLLAKTANENTLPIHCLVDIPVTDKVLNRVTFNFHFDTLDSMSLSDGYDCPGIPIAEIEADYSDEYRQVLIGGVK
jgi:hypothetical protein